MGHLYSGSCLFAIDRNMKLAIFLLLSICCSFTQFSETLTIDDIEKVVAAQNLDTIEKFIQSFDKQTRSQYILMHKSKSVQGATYQKPRVIMFTKDAQMIFSFTGDKTQRNGDKVEIILYDKEKKSFSAHEIDYSQNTPIVHKNPASCLKCHGTDVRPNWNGYSFWRGAYGSNDSRLTMPTHDGPSDLTEYNEIQKLKATYQTHPRYKWLEDFDKMTVLQDDSIPSDKQKVSARMKAHSISQFTDLVMQMNNERFTRIIRTSAAFKHFQYALLTLMSCSMDSFKQSLPGNYPLGVTREFSFPYFKSDSFSVGLVRDTYYSAFLESLQVNPRFLDTSFDLEYPIELFSDPDIISYATSKFSTPSAPHMQFAYSFTRDSNELAPFVTGVSHTQRTADIDCEKLATKSRQEMGKVKLQTNKKPKLVRGREVFETVCLSCHQDPETVRFVFSKKTLPGLLKSNPELIDRFHYRLDSHTPTGQRMPRGQDITRDEREAVVKYIDSFVNERSLH